MTPQEPHESDTRFDTHEARREYPDQHDDEPDQPAPTEADDLGAGASTTTVSVTMAIGSGLMLLVLILPYLSGG